MTWKTVKLGRICKFVRGLTYSKKDEVEYSSNIVLRATNIDLNTNKINLNELRYIKENINIKKDKILQKGDILICTASGSKAHLGKVALINTTTKMAFGGFMGVLKTSKECIPEFLYEVLTSQIFKKKLMSISDGANINNLKFSQIENFEFSLPSLPEQKRIVTKLGSLFTMIDKAIKLSSNKEFELENLKASIVSSYLQDNLGKFKNIKLVDVIDIVMGQAPPGNKCNKKGIGTPFVKVGEFGVSRPIIREWTTEPKKMGTKGDVFLCVVGATCGKINLGDNCAIGRSVAALRPKIDKISQEYLYYFMSQQVMKLRKRSLGAAQTVISKNMINDISIQLPPLAEQNIITAKLNTILSELKININSIIRNKKNYETLRAEITAKELKQSVAA